MSWQCKSWNCIARARKQPFRSAQCFLQNFNELCHCLPGGHWARRAQFSRVVRWLTIMNQFEACEIKQWITWEELWLVQSFQNSHHSVVEILKTFWISKIQSLPGHVLPSHLLPHAVVLALGEGQHAFFCGWTTLPGFGAPDPTTTVLITQGLPSFQGSALIQVSNKGFSLTQLGPHELAHCWNPSRQAACSQGASMANLSNINEICSDFKVVRTLSPQQKIRVSGAIYTLNWRCKTTKIISAPHKGKCNPYNQNWYV